MNAQDTLIQNFSEWLAHERMVSQSTITGYKSDVRKLLNSTSAPITQINYDHLRRHVSALSKQGCKVTTINRKLAAYRMFWRYLVIEHIVRENPAERLKMPRKTQKIPFYLNEGQLRQFAYTPDPSPSFSLAWKLMAWTGIRRAELLNMRIRDLHFTECEIHIIGGKGDRDRRLIMPSQLEADLKALTLGQDVNSWLFSSSTGGRLNVRTFYRHFYAHLQRCGLTDKRITPHTLRHTFLTLMANRGVRDVHLQAMSGHADPKSLVIYRHSDPEALKRAYALFPLNQSSDTESLYQPVLE